MNHYATRRASRGFRPVNRVVANPGGFLDDETIRGAAPSVFAESAHDSRSERFQPIPTFRVLDALRKENFGVVKAMQSTPRTQSRYEFTKHMLRLRKIDATAATRRVGDVFPEVVLVNANDGSSAYHLSAGLFRLVCLNGMTVSEQAFQSVRVPHTGDVVDKVIEGTYRVLDDSSMALQHAERWSALRLNDQQRRAFGEAARIVRWGDTDGNLPQDFSIGVDQVLAPRRHEDVGDSLWQTFNRAQENLVRGGLHGTRVTDQGRTRRTVTRPINGIDGDLRLNRALWFLSERLAEMAA